MEPPGTTTASHVAQPSSEQYFMARSYLGSIRLTMQHKLFIERTQWLLHPTITKHISSSSVSDSGSMQIADVATGNGIWAVELAAQMPHATVTGLDISTEQFPPAWVCARNLRFAQCDIMGPVPAEYLGKFDVVHIRLVKSFLHAGGSDVFLKNIMAMLKPGGWIQWHDVVRPAFARVDPATGSLERNMHTVFTEIEQVRGGFQWPDLLLELLRDVGGFVQTEEMEPKTVIETLKYETDMSQMSNHELVTGFVARLPEGKEEVKERLFGMLAELARDVERGAMYTTLMTLAIGRKPE